MCVVPSATQSSQSMPSSALIRCTSTASVTLASTAISPCYREILPDPDYGGMRTTSVAYQLP